jgi:hypothetical protein
LAVSIAGEKAATADSAWRMSSMLAGRQGVFDEARDDAPDQFMDDAHPLQPGMTRRDIVQQVPQEGNLAQVFEVEQTGAQPVVDVMGVIGDIVGERRALRLGRGEQLKLKRKNCVEFIDFEWNISIIVMSRMRSAQRAIMFDQPFQRLVAQVEPVPAGVAPLQLCDDAQGVGVVVEAAEGRHTGVQDFLASMTETGMAEVMGERRRLGEVFVQRQPARKGPRNLSHFDRMGQAGAEMIAFQRDEHLGLVGEAAEGGRMDQPVAVALEFAARRRGRLGVKPPPAAAPVGGKRRQLDGEKIRTGRDGQGTCSGRRRRTIGGAYHAGRDGVEFSHCIRARRCFHREREQRAAPH